MKALEFIKQEKIFAVIITLSVLSMLRSLIVPLGGDEITYLNITENLLKGKYYLNDAPTTVIPIVPFMMAFFKTNAHPIIGFTLHKLLHLSFFLLGLFFAHSFLKSQKINNKVSLAIVALTVSTSVCVGFVSTLYPDAILFCCFWGFVYYASKESTLRNFKIMLLLFVILVLTRYVYAVLGLLVLIKYYTLLKTSKNHFITATFYSFVFALPVFFWFKYVYNIESNITNDLSYFNRFKTDENPLLYNIKAGLGLIQHHEVNRVNGIPAFISIFVPITGFRHFTLSLVLIIAFIIGYATRKTSGFGIKILFTSICLIMLGLVFAGTGFSRYWIPLIPGFYLGYYFLANKLKIKDTYFVYAAYILSFIYILNEMRVNFVVLSKHL